MDVYLVPLGTERYALYCEQQDHVGEAGDPPRGFGRRLVHRFRETLAEAERERRTGGSQASDAHRSFAARVKARSMRWVAESIAEQRLLWQLRSRPEATLLHPDDISEVHAREILRRSLSADFERHRFWLAIDALLMLASIALVVLPGPNVVWYYFVFRMVGHYFSVRGARHGILKTSWSFVPKAELSTLRAVLGIPPADRGTPLHDVATALGLEHLPVFFQRSATQ